MKTVNQPHLAHNVELQILSPKDEFSAWHFCLHQQQIAVSGTVKVPEPALPAVVVYLLRLPT